MLINDGNVGRYDEVWRASEPYMRARKNDVHIPLSFAFALMFASLRVCSEFGCCLQSQR